MRAIALSVQEQHQGSSSRPIVIDDDDDDEIQLVLAMSAAEAEEQERKKQEQQEAPTDDEEDTEQDKPKDSAEDHKPDNAASTSSAAPGPVSSGLRLGLASIDRAQLEKERLARQAARSGHASTHTPSASTSDTVNVKRASATASKRDTGHPLQSSGPSPRDAAGEYYLDGELRHTKLRIGEASSDRTFTAQDVFESVS